MVALNAKIEKDDFERRNWEEMVALNAVTKKGWWLWMPYYKLIALNVKVRKDGGIECQTEKIW